jgi:hypothetical protein
MKRSSDRGFSGQGHLMTKFSQFVRSRLELGQRQSPDHPDSNLLLAFAERNESPREHANILEHLAGCAECREVLALMSRRHGPDTLLEQGLSKSRASSWRWRFAAAAGLACLAVSTVWWMPLFKSSPHFASRPAIINQLPSSSPPVSTINDSEVSKAQIYDLNQKSVARKLEASEPAGRSSVTSRAKPANELKSNDSISLTAQQTEAQVTTPAPAAPQGTKSRPTLPSAGSNTAPPLALRKDLIAPKAVFSAADRATPLETLMRAPRPHENTVWTLDAIPKDGTIQKSDDGGRTWLTIHIDDTTRFYALSASGSDVWLGGVGGKLFHTSNSGVHWAEITISNERARLTGSITEIEVTPDGTIKLKTDSGETWASDDRGVHWRPE